VAVRAGPARGRGVLAESAAHLSARSAAEAAARGRGQFVGTAAARRAGQHFRPAAQTGRIETDGHYDGVHVLPAVQRLVRAHGVHDTAAGCPKRDGQQLPDLAGGRAHQPGHHGASVGPVVQV